jgi:hypothetical protein
MSPAVWWTVGALGALLAAPFAIHGVTYARAAAWKRRARDACPFEDDDHDTLPAPRALQLVVAESVLWAYAIATAVRPPAETPAGTAHRRVPVIVLAPPGLPRASIRLLVARLLRDGFSVACPRLPGVGCSLEQRVRALDQALRAVWEHRGARVVDVIAPAGAAAVVAAHLARGGSGVPSIRRLLTVGAPGHAGPPIPPPTEVIAFFSYDDPFLGPVEGARRPGAVNIAIRALGRLGLLHAPHVYTLVCEHLLAPAREPAESWPNARS